MGKENYIDVTAAIIQKGKHILIAKRLQTQSHPGKWEFPGGKIEHGETPKDCLRRELLEELNIKVQVEKQCLVFEYDYGRLDKKIHRFFSFWCTILEGEPLLRVHQSLVWVEARDLVKYDIIEADKQLVSKILTEEKL